MGLASPNDIVVGLRDWGLSVKEWPGWRTRGTGYRFAPYAQAWHHDAFGESFGDEAAARYMAEQGRPDLRPPLTNGSIGNHGTVFLLSYGNANHAGWNEADVHDRLRRGLAPLGDARLDPDGDTVVGNPHLWGWECRNAGTGQDPWDQLEVMERTGAAFAQINGWGWEQNVAHRELTARKIDPRGFDMHAFRADIARLMQGDDMTDAERKMLTEIHAALRGKESPMYAVLQQTRYVIPAQLRNIAAAVSADPFDVDELVASLAPALAEALPASAGTITVEDMKAAVRSVFAAGAAAPETDG